MPLQIAVISVGDKASVEAASGDRRSTVCTLQFAVIADQSDCCLVEIQQLAQVDKWTVNDILLIQRWSFSQVSQTILIVPQTTVIDLLNL